MNIVTVDNNPNNLSQLGAAITAILPECQIRSFTDPLLSAKYICNNQVEMVFLTDAMRPANGFKLIRVLRQNIPKLPIIMLSANSMNEVNAMEAGANGFLANPISEERLKSAIHGALLSGNICPVKIQTKMD